MGCLDAMRLYDVACIRQQNLCVSSLPVLCAVCLGCTQECNWLCRKKKEKAYDMVWIIGARQPVNVAGDLFIYRSIKNLNGQ